MKNKFYYFSCNLNNSCSNKRSRFLADNCLWVNSLKHMPDYNPRHIGDYVYELLDKRGMKRSEFCKLGNIPNGTAARLFHPKSPKMGHDLYVKTCILLKLNKEERETLKRIAFPYEALMEYIIDNNMSHNEADYLFEELNLPLLFSSEKDK